MRKVLVVRWRKKSLCFWFMTVFASFLTLWALGRASSLSAKVTIAAAPLPDTIIPEMILDAQSAAFLPNVCEGLVRFQPDSCVVEPCLATRWRVLPDGRAWIFELRPGVRFHDGRPLTAEVVAAVFKRKLEAATRMPHLRVLFGMVVDVDAVGSQRVIFRLKRPYTPFLRNLALPQAAIYVGNELPCGTGAYKIAAKKKGKIILEANRDYWGEKPQLRQVVIREVADAAERFAFFEKGKTSIALDIPLEAIAEGAANTVVKTTAASVSYLGFYTEKEPFNNAQARRAVAHLLNKKVLCSRVYRGILPPAPTLLPPVLGGPTSETVAGASEKLLAAVPADLKRRKLILLTYTGKRPYSPLGGVALAEEVKRQLEAAGLRVEIRAYPWPELKAAIRRRTGDFFLYGWTSDNGDPDNMLFSLLATSQIASGLNTTYYRNPLVDFLVSRGQQLPDSLGRERVYAQVLEIIARECPVVPLNYGIWTATCRPEVRGLKLHPLGGCDFRKLNLRRRSSIRFSLPLMKRPAAGHNSKKGLGGISCTAFRNSKTI